jgi:hypothetical protein
MHAINTDYMSRCKANYFKAFCLHYRIGIIGECPKKKQSTNIAENVLISNCEFNVLGDAHPIHA